MNTELLVSNITNPAFLFFVLGIVAVRLKSDLEIPNNSSKFISMYLLFSIGFKGGQELAHENFSNEIVFSVLAGIALSLLVPVYTYFILRRKLSVVDSGAIAAAYGSVSAVTFVTAAAYIESQNLHMHGHMVAIMALMESPAIISGLILITLFEKTAGTKPNLGHVVKHSLSNGSVLLIVGSLVIGLLADSKQAEGIKPFTNDIFKGFLAIFLLDMGITSGKKLDAFTKAGWFPIAFALIIPLVNGCAVAGLSQFVTASIADRFMLSILAASASYIAVPAAMKITVPTANPGLYLPMALAITFPLNITLGMPLYLHIINSF